jgi:hypothetical protein
MKLTLMKGYEFVFVMCHESEKDAGNSKHKDSA